GIALGVLILYLTGHYTSTEDRPVRQVAGTSRTGAATVVLSGFSLGLESAVFTALVIAAAVFGAFLLRGSGVAGLFAIALAGCGLLTTVGVIVAMDTFGPVTDNPQGIAEMSGDVGGEGAQVLTELDAVGNTTRAITKGIAIATAVLAATALFVSYTDAIHEVLGERYQDFLDQSVVFSPQTLVGVIIGAAVVFLFSGLAISAVGRAAGAVVYEVRRQFRELTGIMERTAEPADGGVVAVVTRGARPPPPDHRDHGANREAGVRARGRDRRPRLAARAGHSRSARGRRAQRRRLRARRPGPGRLPRRCDLRRGADGDPARELGRRLGQRQEDRRGRPPRREGLRRP